MYQTRGQADMLGCVGSIPPITCKIVREKQADLVLLSLELNALYLGSDGKTRCDPCSVVPHPPATLKGVLVMCSLDVSITRDSEV